MTAGLDAWSRSQPDRCDRCGWHVRTQGHGPACTPVAPADEKAAAYAEFKRILATAVGADGLIHQTAVRPRIQHIPHKWRGQFYKRAKDEGFIVRRASEPSTDRAGKNTHHEQTVYELRSAA